MLWCFGLLQRIISQKHRYSWLLQWIILQSTGTVGFCSGSFHKCTGTFRFCSGSFRKSTGTFRFCSRSFRKCTGTFRFCCGSSHKSTGTFCFCIGSFCKSTDTFRFCTGSFCKTTCAAHFTHKKFRNDAERSSVRRYSPPAITRVSRALKWRGVIRRPVSIQS